LETKPVKLYKLEMDIPHTYHTIFGMHINIAMIIKGRILRGSTCARNTKI